MTRDLDSLRQHGVCILKRAFDPDLIRGLIERAVSHGALMQSAALTGTPLEFARVYAFFQRALAVNLTALDPVTSALQVNDFTRTTLCSVMMNATIRTILVQILGPRSGWASARARVVLPEPVGANGRLALHMEKTAVRFPGLYNLWTPLTPIGIETNSDAPGIQFYLGRKDYFTNAPEADVSGYITSLSSKSWADHPEPDDDGFFYRPKRRSGDLAIFTGSVPHASFVPTDARSPRVGCDVGVFPWTDVNDLPPDAISKGQGPAPFIWPFPESPDTHPNSRSH